MSEQSLARRGHGISSQVAGEAADWLTLLMSEEATDEAWQALQQWRAADAEHERAWQHIERVTGRMRSLAPETGYRSLSVYQAARSSRRQMLGLLLSAGSLGLLATLGSRTQLWQAATADYHSGTGQQRQVSLPDGSRILLNTATSIDVVFDQQQRLIRLLAGEISVTSGHLAAPGQALPPLLVATPEGHIRALGTRFSVRSHAQRTAVAVQQSTVQIIPQQGSAQLLHEHQQASFNRFAVEPPQPVGDDEPAWVRGQLIADEQPLGAFLEELSRYRPGIIRCDSRIARLRVSGVFPLDDSDRILETLSQVLPIDVHQRTRYWVSVEPG